jgi:hypothetical protein
MKPEHAFTHRHRRGISIAAAFLVFGAGYGIRAIQDHGWKAAALRAEAMLQANSAPAPPPTYATVPIHTIAAGGSRATYATVVGDVTQVSNELDGDYHIRVEGHGAFLVLEIMPEFPLASPQDWTYRKNDRDIGGASSSVPPLAHDRRPSLLDGAVAEHEPGPATLGT